MHKGVQATRFARSQTLTKAKTHVDLFRGQASLPLHVSRHRTASNRSSCITLASYNPFKFAARQKRRSKSGSKQPSGNPGVRVVKETWGKLLYKYYNWRQDTSSDLQLVMLAFACLILGNSLLRSLLVNARAPNSLPDYWSDMYEVIILSFGQEFPDIDTAGIPRQVFSVGVAGIGLCFLALVLALVEQVVLETIEQNVRQGSQVYETGHVLVLGWCYSQRDLEVVWKSLEQLCHAHRNDGGIMVVVLTQRQKLEMESLFRRAIPEEKRFGTRFVFRQGNPLVVEDLDMVAAQDAQSIMVVSDQSRCPEEADAQSLRCAILLDELTFCKANMRCAQQATSQDQSASSSTFMPTVSWPFHAMAGSASSQQIPMLTSTPPTTVSTSEPSAALPPPSQPEPAMLPAAAAPAPAAAPAAADASPAESSDADTSGRTQRSPGRSAWQVVAVPPPPDPDMSEAADSMGLEQYGDPLASMQYDFDDEPPPLPPRPMLSLPPVMQLPQAGSITPFTGLTPHQLPSSTINSLDPSLHVLPSRPSILSNSPGTPYSSILAYMTAMPPELLTVEVKSPLNSQATSSSDSAQSADASTSPGPTDSSDASIAASIAGMDPMVAWRASDATPEPSREAGTAAPSPSASNGTDAAPSNGANGTSSNPIDNSLANVFAAGRATNGSNGAGGLQDGAASSIGTNLGEVLSSMEATQPASGDAADMQLAVRTALNSIVSLRQSESDNPLSTLDGGLAKQPMQKQGDGSLQAPGRTQSHASMNGYGNANGNGNGNGNVNGNGSSNGNGNGRYSPATSNSSAPGQNGNGNGNGNGQASATTDQGAAQGQPVSVATAQDQQQQQQQQQQNGPSSPFGLAPPSPEKALTFRGGESINNMPMTSRRISGHVIVEMKTSNAVPLLKFACSSRFMAVPTAHLNARRLAKMIREPIIASVGQQIQDFKTPSNMFVQHVPELVGIRFGELNYWFDDAIVMGIYKGSKDRVYLVPSGAYVVAPEDQLVLLRPTFKPGSTYHPRKTPVIVPPAKTQWSGAPSQSQESFNSANSMNGSADGSMSDSERQEQQRAAAEAAARPAWISQDEPTADSSDEMGEDAEDAAHIDRQARAAAHAAFLGDVNLTEAPSAIAHAVAPDSDDIDQDGSSDVETDTENRRRGGRAVSSPPTTADLTASWVSKVALRAGPDMTDDSPRSMSRDGDDDDRWEAYRSRVGSQDFRDGAQERVDTWISNVRQYGSDPGAKALASQDAASLISQQGGPSKSGSSLLSSFESSPQTSAIFMVPMEWLVVDERPRRVLVCGWGEQSFMRALLRELDQGQAALPPGSEVVFANLHETESSLGRALQTVRVRNISVTHVVCDPMMRAELSQLGMDKFSAAIVLCDERWMDPDEDTANGVDMLGQADMLRLDSMVMMVQLNVRKVLEDGERPSINIICQKVAMAGMTRFEDRKRLPLGISVNFTAFAAKLLTQATYSPMFLPAFSQFGASGDFKVVDASLLADLGERLTYWQLVTRALMLKKILIGWYLLPERVEQPMEVVVNPQGNHLRSKKRVWNKGNNTLKFVVLQRKQGLRSMQSVESLDADDDDAEMEDAVADTMADLDNRQATWVQLCVAAAADTSRQQQQGCNGQEQHVRHRNRDDSSSASDSDNETPSPWVEDREEEQEVDTVRVA